MRICGDYKVTANIAMKVDSHPIPRIEELFTAMSGGVSFTKLDLSHAYLQLQLDESAKEYLVINTHMQGPFLIHPYAIQGCIRTIDFSKNNGQPPTRP